MSNKSPFNWVGNKYKYIEVINSILKEKDYNNIIDLFMGTGNLLLNIESNANCYIGNDKIKLIPQIYQELGVNNYHYDKDDIVNILKQFDNFSTKESYYTFRDYWNKKYLSDNFDKDFILETILLLKMCSNSMVRFNPKQGYFNQGFRGLGNKTEFFTETMKDLCLNEINKLSDNLSLRKYKFDVTNFINYIDEGSKDLLILDPPYILRKDMYDTDWTEEHDIKLLDILTTTKNDFIYFNYIERDGVQNDNLIDLIKQNHFKTIHINNKTLAGQGRSENVREVKEVIITNIN